jgi:hypothetical protein
MNNLMASWAARPASGASEVGGGRLLVVVGGGGLGAVEKKRAMLLLLLLLRLRLFGMPQLLAVMAGDANVRPWRRAAERRSLEWTLLRLCESVEKQEIDRRATWWKVRSGMMEEAAVERIDIMVAVC